MALTPAQKNIALFCGTFVSTLVLVLGLTTLFLTYAPAIAAPFEPTPAPYFPQLPLAENRDEEFIDIDSLQGKQLFPPLPEVSDVDQGNWIRIPSIGVNVPLALAPTIDDKDVIATLEYGAALYPNGIVPGRLGNVFIAAHSTGEPWRGKYRFAFLKINEIAGSNLIHLDYNGTRYTYEVAEAKIVKPQAGFKVESGRPVPTVTLMACWPLWTTNQRYLVTAELKHITKLTQTPS
ncbi:MAG: sortase [Candidatus Andersenbacteria bacterium]|nr:sortase [Candidatus Andersenbacteria bacterium]